MKKIFVTLAVIVVVGYAGYIYLSGRSVQSYTVTRGEVAQKVSETGRIINAEEYDLLYEFGGKASKVYAKVGDEIKAGNVLVELNKKEFDIQLSQANARRSAAQAKLDRLLAGATAEDVKINETAVNNAKTAVENAEIVVENAKISLLDAKNDLINKIQDTYTKADDAVRNKADQLFTNPRTSSPNLIFTTDQQIEINVENGRVAMKRVLTSWEPALRELSVSDDLENAVEEAKRNMADIKSFIDEVSLAVNDLTPATNLSQATIDGYKTDIFAARTNINTAVINLTTSQEKFNTAVSVLRTANGDLKKAMGALQSAEDELAFKKAGPRDVDIEVYKSQIEDAQGAIELLQKKLRDTVLRAPVQGIVTAVNVEEGERIAPNQVAVSMMSGARYELEVFIPEEDIVNVAEGLPIEFTLDAFPSNMRFRSNVSIVEPSATIIEEEVYYKVKGEIAEEIAGIREGMTADVDIIVSLKENVLKIPEKAVETEGENGKKFVRVETGAFKKEKRQINTGIVGGGFVEVISGLREGEKIIVQ